MRPLLESTRILTGSGRSLCGRHPAWLSLVTVVRNSLPAATLRSRETDASKEVFMEWIGFDVDAFMAWSYIVTQRPKAWRRQEPDESAFWNDPDFAELDVQIRRTVIGL